jgi:sensor domain CHASE-containing protein
MTSAQYIIGMIAGVITKEGIMKRSGMVKKAVYSLCGLGMLLLLGFATVGQQNRKEDSEQLIQQVKQELKTARDQVSKVDTDSAGHKYKLEQLLDQAERETQDLATSLEKKR